MDKPIVDHSIKELLLELGKGKGMRGAVGSAAITAQMGIAILESVCKITMGSKRYTLIHNKVQTTLKSLQRQQAQLSNFAQQDVDAVSAMINDQQFTPELSSTPLEICKLCMATLEETYFLYNNAYQPMKGDTITALLMICSTARATLHISKSNLSRANTAISNDEVAQLTDKLKHLQQELDKLSN